MASIEISYNENGSIKINMEGSGEDLLFLLSAGIARFSHMSEIPIELVFGSIARASHQIYEDGVVEGE